MVKTIEGLAGGISMNGGLIPVGSLDRMNRGDLGRCCGCGIMKATSVLLIPLELPRELDLEGMGWSCIRCDNGFKHAIAVLCPACYIAQSMIGPAVVQTFVDGPLTSHSRLPISDLVGIGQDTPRTIQHNERFHVVGTPPQIGQEFFWSHN